MIEWVMCGALRWFGHEMRMSDNDSEEGVKGKWINKVDEHWRELVGMGEGVLEQR